STRRTVTRCPAGAYGPRMALAGGDWILPEPTLATGTLQPTSAAAAATTAAPSRVVVIRAKARAWRIAASMATSSRVSDGTRTRATHRACARAGRLPGCDASEVPRVGPSCVVTVDVRGIYAAAYGGRGSAQRALARRGARLHDSLHQRTRARGTLP